MEVNHGMCLIRKFGGSLQNHPLIQQRLAWGVIEAPIAALAGAWIYREDSGDTGTR